MPARQPRAVPPGVHMAPQGVGAPPPTHPHPNPNPSPNPTPSPNPNQVLRRKAGGLATDGPIVSRIYQVLSDGMLS